MKVTLYLAEKSRRDADKMASDANQSLSQWVQTMIDKKKSELVAA